MIKILSLTFYSVKTDFEFDYLSDTHHIMTWYLSLYVMLFVQFFHKSME